MSDINNTSRILMTGGTGFIGNRLCASLINYGHNLTVLTRDKVRAAQSIALPIKLIESLNEIEEPIDIIINLAGSPIAVRWTEKAKREIEDSRFETTQRVIEFISKSESKPKLLISGSAIGYYGNSASARFSETSIPSDDGFTHQLCKKWEDIAQQAEVLGVRVVLLRTGIVLERDGGIIQQLWRPFNIGLGGKIGDGQQIMSWIHMDDVMAIIEMIISDETLRGPLNLTAPTPVSNTVFSQSFAEALNKPTLLSTPAFVLKMIYGTMAEKLLLEGQTVLPTALERKGYKFKYSDINSALQAVVNKTD